ncbi:hypothetical protein Tco_1056824 [Tanacetum coccineum]|uniref:Uncharacterized protein n=1 Tax=Tanacetum coccineum TaxID=301880 RepID=A0ABQ5H5G1_9ASTR
MIVIVLYLGVVSSRLVPGCLKNFRKVHCLSSEMKTDSDGGVIGLAISLPMCLKIVLGPFGKSKLHLIGAVIINLQLKLLQNVKQTTSASGSAWKSTLVGRRDIFQRTNLSDINGTSGEYQLSTTAFTTSTNIPAIYLQQKALAITPVIPAHPFELPPSGNIVIDFVNELVSCCGEEFTQGIQTFFSHKASHKASLKNPKKKVTPLLIPYGRFSKVIIYYLASNNNIHRRPDSAVHHTGDDYILGNLKFVPKERKTPQESASVQPATKRATPKKPTTTTPVKQTKPAPPPTKKPSKRKLPQKVRKGKPTFQLVDEDDEAQQESAPQEEGNDPDLEMAKKMSLETHQGKGREEEKEKSKAREESDSTIPNPSHQTVTCQTLCIVLPFTRCLILKAVNTGLLSTNSTPESYNNHHISPWKSLHSSPLQYDSSGQIGTRDVEVRRTDHSTESWLQLMDPNLRRDNYSVLPWPRVCQDIKIMKRVPKEIIKAKKEHFDNDEDAMDKEVAARFKDHKRKNDSDVMKTMM